MRRQVHYFTVAVSHIASISNHQLPICHSTHKLARNTKDRGTRVQPVEREEGW